MLDPSYLLTPLNPAELGALLQELFGLHEVRNIQFVHGGYMGQNFRIDTADGVFFLKQYRNRINTIIHEIKAAEAYFAQQGLPVITPRKDSYGREAFWMNGNWYSLFPFVTGASPTYGAISAQTLQSLARLLAEFHRAGKRFPTRPFQMVRIGNPRKFTLEAVELMHALERQDSRSLLEERILEILSRKKDLVAHNTLRPQDLSLAYDCLLHGDYQYLNTFMNERGDVTHVYDLERASLGPSAYELVRSLIINCFDDAWKEQNFARGRLYLSTYRESFPITREEFIQAVQLYTYSIIHMTWIEARYVVFGVDMQLPIFERHIRRLEQLATQNPYDFCERLWK